MRGGGGSGALEVLLVLLEGMQGVHSRAETGSGTRLGRAIDEVGGGESGVGGMEGENEEGVWNYGGVGGRDCWEGGRGVGEWRG